MRSDQGTQKTHRAPALARALRLLAPALLAATFLALSAAPAWAVVTHPLITTFGGSNKGVAVDESNGNVFVAEGESNKIKIYGPEGGAPAGGIATTEIGPLSLPLSSATLAIDNSPTSSSKGALYVPNAGVIKKYVLNPAKEYEYLCQISGPGSGCTAAGGSGSFGGTPNFTVDSKGNLFVAVYVPNGEDAGAIYEFGPAGEDLASIPIEPNAKGSRQANAIAVDSAGNLFVQLYGGTGSGGVYEYKADGSGEIAPGTKAVKLTSDTAAGQAIAVDSGSGDRYFSEQTGGGRIVQYSPAGALEGEFGKGILSSNIQGIAVNSQSGNVYVADAGGGKVALFGPAVLVPDAATEKATDLTRTTATLHGTLNAAGGPAATCVFQYATEASFKAEGFKGATSAPCDPAGPFTGSSETAVSAALTGLVAGTTYHFRLLASNENGDNEIVNELSFQAQAAVTLETDKVSNLSSGAATLNGTITPDGIALEECLFEYLSDSAYQANLEALPDEDPFTGAAIAPCEEPDAAEVGTGNAPVAVHADVSGLDPSAVYHFRLAAKNSFGTTKGADFLFGPPKVDAEAITQVTLTAATVVGLVNPDGVATTYVVQYVSEAAFVTEGEWDKATSVPLGGEAIGSGLKDVEVAQQLSGLIPLTTYHFRIVADNAAGKATGPGKTFTTYPEAGVGLPDGRAYEQATAIDKGATNPRGELDLVKAARDGSAISFYATGGIPGGEGSQNFPNYLARRAPDGSGWATQGLLPPAANGSSAYVLGYNEDLTQTYVTQAATPASLGGFYQRDAATHEMRAMVSGAIKAAERQNAYGGESADGSKVLIELTHAQGIPGAPDSQNTYVWDKATGTLSLAGVLNDEQAPAEGTSPGSYELPNNSPHNYTTYEHAISADGSRVFFTAIASHQAYLRLNPTQPQSPISGSACTDPALACTVQVSASKRTVAPLKDEKPATLWFATPDGSQAFFTSSGKLTNNAKTGAKDEGNDLYRYDVENDQLTDLSVDSKPSDPNGAEVQGVIGTSDDGSYVYFVANGVLTEEPNAEGQSAEAGDCKVEKGKGESLDFTNGHCNLYLWHEGEVSFIAPQHAIRESRQSDAINWVRKSAPNAGKKEKTARLTADGATLVFRSQEKLTPYDNEGFSQLYRYSAEDSELICVSCNPTGAAPVDSAGLQSIKAFPLNTLEAGQVQTRNLSADGNQVFFESPDKLVASDTNGEGGCPFIVLNAGAAQSFQRICQDVYEWEANGTGSCHSEAQNGGCLYLISTGTSPEPSYFADASASGDDAFFFTAQPLVAQDKDELVDIYDARVGGGIAAQNALPGPICEGEACKPAVAPPPAPQSPGSSSFSGPGNPKPTPHKKKQKKHQHKKKQHKKRHAARVHG